MSEATATILVVDDEPSNIDVMRGVLLPDYVMKVALSGEKALAIASRTPCPDVVLLDVMMPGLDGYEVCRRLKADPATEKIPVVFVSGHTGEAERQRGLSCGAADFLSKPVDPEAVRDVVRRALGGPARG
jgi:CheY-like chemotaxis protein